jgi:YHS domain-containing protein
MKMTLVVLSLSLGLAACEVKSEPPPPRPMVSGQAIAATRGIAPAAAQAAPAAEPTQASPANAGLASVPPMIAVGTKLKCPVSGEDFTVKANTAQVVHAGKRYAFCCPDCLPEFNKNPAKFAAK